MIETRGNTGAVMARIARHAEQRAIRWRREQAGTRPGPEHAWRSARALWPDFAQD